MAAIELVSAGYALSSTGVRHMGRSGVRQSDGVRRAGRRSTLQLSLIAPSEIIQVDAKIAPRLDQVPIPRRIEDEDAAFRR